MNKAEFFERRKRLMEKMGPGSIGILMARPECIRTGDAEYPYRQDSDFYYVTGFSEPEAVAVFIPGRKEGEFILFNRPHDKSQEVWTGQRAGQTGAVELYGADQSFSIEEFPVKFLDLLINCEKICYSVGRYPDADQQIISAVKQLQNQVRMGVVVPQEFIDIGQWLREMRVIKNKGEIESMRKAAHISALAHRRAMQKCKAGLYEYQLAAEIAYEFSYHGSSAPAYNSIVGSGANTCILHYSENSEELKDGDLVLIDAGCEYEGYASDITRTFPVNGRFSAEQRAVYEVVLAAQLKAIAQARPGVTMNDLHLTALNVLVEGLVKMGFLKGSVSELIEQKAYLPFFMHRTGHWLGLDTHDVGNYKIKNDWRPFEPGMVLTVEPGLYIAANTPGVDKKWWNIGVRIEDDILITKSACEVLSHEAPKTVKEIEELMQAAHGV